MREQVRHRAPAKLTLTLRVMGRRNDGYHLIDAEMTTLELADELTFSDGENDLAPEDLVSRALAAVGRPAGVHVMVDKQIPVGAGLGGGSADAAAVLRWAGCTDLDVAVALGADVPFCVVGGRARVTGIGEVVEPLPDLERTFTLLTPPFPVWTPLVYSEWDDMGGPRGEGLNDLEPAALRVEPRLVKWRDRLGEATGQTPRLAGSGGTWFVEGAYFDVAGGVVTRTSRP